jgi:formylglycine-generating enzyme required for sulfatase activity
VTANFSNTAPLETLVFKQWDKSFGGDGHDLYLYSIQPIADGGCLLGGTSESGISGNKTAPGFGGRDYWVVKIDASGNKLWDKTFGGAGSDIMWTLVPTSDSGFLLGGESDSDASGNKTSPGFGLRDYWLIKIDANGNKVWEKVFGGSAGDGLAAIQPTSDGGYLLGGYSASGVTGNKSSHNWGGNDIWVVKIDAEGNKLWDKSYGGTAGDTLGVNGGIQPTGDGGYLLGGSSYSGASGSKTTDGFGDSDFWLVKVDANGTQLWDKTYGGTSYEAGISAIQVASDGGYLLGGTSKSSPSGNKASVNHGDQDYWIVKIDESGTKLWDAAFGGPAYDYLAAIEPANDSGYLLGGGSQSGVGGNKSSPSFGDHDYWLVKIDGKGTILWDKSFGGDGPDYGSALQAANDGGYLLGSYSSSRISGNKGSSSFGGVDLWLVKVFTPSTVAPSAGPNGTISPNTVQTVGHGGSITFTAAPGPDYVVDQWLTNSVLAQTGGATFTLTKVTADTFVEVTFKLSSVVLETQLFTQWQQAFGGNGDDNPISVKQTSDGGYVLGGWSTSGVSGNKTLSGYGGRDFWVIKTDPAGNKQWERVFGGSGGDTLTALQQTQDAGYVLVGYSESENDGNKLTPGFGSLDYWLIKLDNAGNRQWERVFGGTAGDSPTVVWQTPDGGFILGGLSDSEISGNKTAPHFGLNDIWVVKVDASGNMEWDATFGGNSREELGFSHATLSLTRDGGYILNATSQSGVSGNKITGNFGDYDYWLLKLDMNGNKQWEQVFGGTGLEFAQALEQTGDGGYLLGGGSGSGVSGNKTAPNWGDRDYWIIKTDANGNKEWDQTFGGSATDDIYSVRRVGDGGYLLLGFSASGANGNKINPSLGADDAWLVKVDSAGRKQWEHVFGGSGDEIPQAPIELTTDGGFILVIDSNSGVDGNKTTTPFGGSDYWLVKAIVREAPIGTPVVLVNSQFSPNNSHTVSNTATVALETTFSGGTIYYTLDGSKPSASSTRYTAPFTVSQSSTLRTIAFSSDGSQSALGDHVSITITASVAFLTIAVADPLVHITLSGEVGKTYVIEASSNLVDWRPVSTNLIPAGGSVSFTETRDPNEGKRFYRAVTGLIPVVPPENWVWIAPGTFTMGSPTTEQDRYDWEGPQTMVTLTKGFYMSAHEVTQAEYLAVVGSNPSHFTDDLNRPVERVTWIEATNYCARLTQREQEAGRLPAGWAYRLPTEAEWEYACRAGTTTRFSYGDDLNYALLGDYAWFSGNSGGATHPVGLKKANPWGLYDLHGNVWEWCLDWYGGTLPGGNVTDPVGPRADTTRVLRGGGWGDDGRSCRSARRSGTFPDDRVRDNRFGFRAVLAPVLKPSAAPPQ